jgi:hypothetical protein
LNKLREYQDWQEKSDALSQWLEMTDRKLDCCSELSDDLDEQDKQRIFLKVKIALGMNLLHPARDSGTDQCYSKRNVFSLRTVSLLVFF